MRTKKEMYELIKNLLADNEEVVDFCFEQIAALEKKAQYGNAKRKAKAEQNNAELDKRIVEVLTNAEEPMTCKAIAEELGDVSYPKVTPRLKALVEKGQVAQTTVDLKYAYTIAE